jgi:hypothetical protein
MRFPTPHGGFRANANYPGIGYRVETSNRLIALEAQGEMIAPSGAFLWLRCNNFFVPLTEQQF